MSAPPPRRPPPPIGSPKKRSRPAPQAVDQLGKRKKPKDMPRRPLSAYNMYFQEERKKTIAKYKQGEVQDDFCLPPGKDPSEALFQAVSRTVANRWKTISDVQRKPFYDRAQTEMDIYRQKMDEYNQKMIDSSTLAQRLAETQREQLAESRLLTEQLERERRAKQSGAGEGGAHSNPATAATPSAPPSSTSSSTAVNSMHPLLENIPDGYRAMMLASRLQQPPHPQQQVPAYSFSTSTAFPATGQQKQDLISRQNALQQLLQECYSQHLPTTAPRLPHGLSSFAALGGGTPSSSSLYPSANSNNSGMMPSTMTTSEFPTPAPFPGSSGSHAILQQQHQQGNDHAILQQQIQQLLAQQQQQQQQHQTPSLETLLQELARDITQQRAPVASFPSHPHASVQQHGSNTNSNDTLLRMLQLERLMGLPSPAMQPPRPPPPQQLLANSSDNLGHLLQEQPELIQLLQAAQQLQQQEQTNRSVNPQEEQSKWAEDLLRMLSGRNP